MFTIRKVTGQLDLSSLELSYICCTALYQGSWKLWFIITVASVLQKPFVEEMLLTSCLQDFSTILFWICSVKLIGPVSWISHWRPFARLSLWICQNQFIETENYFLKEKSSLGILLWTRGICTIDIILWMRAQIWILNLWVEQFADILYFLCVKV